MAQGLLSFYGLPHPNAAAAAAGAPAARPPPKKAQQGAKFELHTLPVRHPAGARFPECFPVVSSRACVHGVNETSVLAGLPD